MSFVLDSPSAQKIVDIATMSGMLLVVRRLREGRSTAEVLAEIEEAYPEQFAAFHKAILSGDKLGDVFTALHKEEK